MKIINFLSITVFAKDFSTSTRTEVFCKKDVLKNLRYFPVNSAKFLKIPFLTENLRWLLLLPLRCFPAGSTTCSKLTIETLEQGVKYFKLNNKDIRTIPDFIVNFERILFL